MLLAVPSTSSQPLSFSNEILATLLQLVVNWLRKLVSLLDAALKSLLVMLKPVPGPASIKLKAELKPECVGAISEMHRLRHFIGTSEKSID